MGPSARDGAQVRVKHQAGVCTAEMPCSGDLCESEINTHAGHVRGCRTREARQQTLQPVPNALGNAVLGKRPHRGSHNRQDKSPLVPTGPRLQGLGPGVEEAPEGTCPCAASFGPEKGQMLGAGACSPSYHDPWPVPSSSEALRWSWHSLPDGRGWDRLRPPTPPALAVAPPTASPGSLPGTTLECSCVPSAWARGTERETELCSAAMERISLENCTGRQLRDQCAKSAGSPCGTWQGQPRRCPVQPRAPQPRASRCQAPRDEPPPRSASWHEAGLPFPLALARLVSTVIVPGQDYLAVKHSAALSFCCGQQDSSPGFHNTLPRQRLTVQGRCRGKKQWDGWGDGRDEDDVFAPPDKERCLHHKLKAWSRKSVAVLRFGDLAALPQL